jgi:hypothetical protein
MITQPSCSRYLDVIRDELRTSVAPAVTDPAALATLGMIDSILANVIARCDHEVAWMREEIARVEHAAEAVLDAGADPGGTVAAGLETLRANRSASDHTADVRAEYDLAGEVLSRSLEAGLAAGPPLAALVRGVLEERLAREIEIRGDFSLVGR